jgi:mono/diheme cytochrome c family protein
MQGIDFGPDGTLYAAEHGPKTDDEINILKPGENYGWPHVAGFRDDMAYQYARWSEAETPCEQLEFSDIEIHPSVPREDETDWEGDFVEPIATMFTVPDDYDFTDPECEGIDFICWPTVAVTSIEYYGDDAIPGWQNSLLVPTLKRGSLYRLPLTEDGQEAAGPVYRYFQSENRFRDIAVAPDGATFYIATDPSGLAEAIGGGTTTTMENPGAILVFTHAPDADDAAADDAASEEPAADEAAAASGGADDDGLPAEERMPPLYTEAQADRGKTAYNSNCAVCHGSTLTNGTMGTPLAGTYFRGQWDGRSVAELYEYAHTNMPPSDPGSLPDQTYADIVAYVLETNGIEAADAELDPGDPQLAQQIIALENGEGG